MEDNRALEIIDSVIHRVSVLIRQAHDIERELGKIRMAISTIPSLEPPISSEFAGKHMGKYIEIILRRRGPSTIDEVIRDLRLGNHQLPREHEAAKRDVGQSLTKGVRNGKFVLKNGLYDIRKERDGEKGDHQRGDSGESREGDE